MHKVLKKYLVFGLFYATIFISFYLGEDSLGGSEEDFLFHLKFIDLFNTKDFSIALNEYGYGNYIVRNSPIFYIVLSFLDNFLTLDNIRYINSLVSILIAFFFFKCLKIKYKNINENKLILVSSIVFLSPTIRSLSVWPYPYIWGLLFFLISLFYFLKYFDDKKKLETNFYLSIFFLSLSSYLHINFCVFGIFFLYKYFKRFEINIRITKLLSFCLILATPALYFIFLRSGIYFFSAAEGLPVTYNEIFNFSNKITIISTILLFFLIPFINLRIFYDEIKKIDKKIFFRVLLITLVLSYFFDYPFTNYFGGGFFFKTSYILTKNSLLFYLIFFFSLIVLYTLSENKFENYLLFLILVLFNLQFTIYNKYYDPLLIFMIFLVFNFDIQKYFFKTKNYLHQCYSLLIIFYFFNYAKLLINF